jgi:hypothetical protein
MKKIFVIIIMIYTSIIFVNAQTKRDGRNNINNLKDNLSLTEEQSNQIEIVLINTQSRMDSLSIEQMKEQNRFNKIANTIFQENNKSIENILSKDQIEKFKKITEGFDKIPFNRLMPGDNGFRGCPEKDPFRGMQSDKFYEEGPGQNNCPGKFENDENMGPDRMDNPPMTGKIEMNCEQGMASEMDEFDECNDMDEIINFEEFMVFGDYSKPPKGNRCMDRPHRGFEPTGCPMPPPDCQMNNFPPKDGEIRDQKPNEFNGDRRMENERRDDRDMRDGKTGDRGMRDGKMGDRGMRDGKTGDRGMRDGKTGDREMSKNERNFEMDNHQPGRAPGMPGSPDFMLSNLKEKLNLSEEQYKQIEKIFADNKNKIDQMMKDGKGKPPDMKAMEQIRNENVSEIEKLLDKDQKEIFKKISINRRSNSMKKLPPPEGGRPESDFN